MFGARNGYSVWSKNTSLPCKLIIATASPSPLSLPHFHLLSPGRYFILKKSGKEDYLTKHADCSVLVGSKWGEGVGQEDDEGQDKRDRKEGGKEGEVREGNRRVGNRDGRASVHTYK